MELDLLIVHGSVNQLLRRKIALERTLVALVLPDLDAWVEICFNGDDTFCFFPNRVSSLSSRHHRHI